MFNWDAQTWALLIGGVGIVVAVGAWLRPRSARPRKAPQHEQLRVFTSNHFPVFDQADGSSELGDHLVGVTVSNGSSRPVKAVGWGVHLPDGQNLVMLHPTTPIEPALPHWIQPGDDATWYLLADQARRQALDHGYAFADMRAYVSFADGRQVTAKKGLPLA